MACMTLWVHRLTFALYVVTETTTIETWHRSCCFDSEFCCDFDRECTPLSQEYFSHPLRTRSLFCCEGDDPTI
jgi:hypothetical protein